MTNNSAAHSPFPKAIPFPRIERPHRPSCGGLARVRKASDLPSRLIFGDLDESSFKASAEGWEANYRDGSGNGLELSVTDRQFLAKPTFLGASGLSCGPVDPPRAFGELLNLGAPQWQAKLREHLEARYPITVHEHDRNLPSALYLPDGWLHTLLIPVAPEGLPRLLEWHLSLTDDPRLAAAMTGSVALAFNAVNYIEGRWASGLDPDYLAFRSVSMTRTPLAGPVASGNRQGRQLRADRAPGRLCVSLHGLHARHAIHCEQPGCRGPASHRTRSAPCHAAVGVCTRRRGNELVSTEPRLPHHLVMARRSGCRRPGGL